MEQTSLARQLKQLATPQTALLLQQKIRASVLFDPKEASSIDKDTVFALGSTGFQKLLLIEPSFRKFQNFFFSDSSKDFERSVQDRSSNQLLDEKIQRFLTMLSPYILLRAAHEALEWLIYRFHIHMFNTDALISCVLPHYSSKIFVRVIQILDLRNESSRWHWLMVVQKSGKPLELSVLLKQFNSNRGLRKLICNLASNIVSLYPAESSSCQTIVSFSMVTVYYALMQQKTVKESFVTFLFPYIMSGLKSKVAGFSSGVYLIISSLVMKVKFTEEIVENLCLNIVKNMVDEHAKYALEVLMLIFQYQDIESLPKGVARELCSKENLCSRLYQLCSEYSDAKFVMCLIRKCIPLAFKQEPQGKSQKTSKELNFLVTLFEHVVLNEQKLKICFNAIMKRYVKLRSKCCKKSEISCLLKTGNLLLDCLERQSSRTFDKVIKSYFKGVKNKSQKVFALHLLNSAIGYLKHHVLDDSGLTLFLAVNHPHSVIRENAVKKFISVIKLNEIDDESFVESTLLNRLEDDESNIVLKVLSLHDRLFDFLPQEKLLNALIGLLQRDATKTHKGRVIQHSVITVLCKQSFDDLTDDMSLRVLAAIFPFMLPLLPEDIALFNIILKSEFSRQHPILRIISEKCLMNSNSSVVSLIELVLSSLQQIGPTLDIGIQDAIATYLQSLDYSKVDCRMLLLTLFFIQSIYSTKKFFCERQYNLFSKFLLYLDELLSSGRLSNLDCDLEQDLNSILSLCARHLRKEHLPLPAVCYILQVMIKEVGQVKRHYERGRYEDSDFKMIRELFVFLIKYVNRDGYSRCFQHMLTKFIKSSLPTACDVLWFLSYFWCNSRFDIGSKLYRGTFMIASVFCPLLSPEELFDDVPMMLPSLLVTFSESDSCLRSESLKFFCDYLVPLCQNSSSLLKDLIAVIHSHQEEIKSDHRYLSYIIAHWLSPAFEDHRNSKTSESSQTFVFNYLVKLASCLSTPYKVTNVVLQFFQDVKSPYMFSLFIHILKEFIPDYVFGKTLCEDRKNIIKMLVQDYLPASVERWSLKSEELILFASIIQTFIHRDNAVDTTIQEIALSALSKEVFSAIPFPESQQFLFNVLLDLYIDVGIAEVNANVGKTLRKLCIHAYLILKDLPENVGVIPKRTSLKEIQKSRRQPTDSFANDAFEKGPWKRVIVVLEFIQSKKNLRDKDMLVSELFRLLGLSLDLDNNLSGEYVRQLILASIHNCCDQFENGQMPESKFQVELIIQCIRSSENPQTHHQALIVLNLAAKIFPDHVLNNIMSIFTFMGSSLVRQDDSYSFQIISQTIETIIPALQQTSDQKESAETMQVMASIVRLFVNSLPDIPIHRRSPLFYKLINSLGPSDYLWVPLAQICERYVLPTRFAEIFSSKQKSKEMSPTQEFAIALHQQFSLSVQLDTCCNIVRHLKNLPFVIEHNKQNKSAELDKEPFDISSHTNKQLQEYKEDLLSYISQWLSSDTFLNLVCESEECQVQQLESQYKILLEETLDLLQIVSKSVSYNSVFHLLCKFLHCVNSLLSCKMFVKVIKKLLQNQDFEIRLKAAEMLNAKLEHQPKFFSHGNDLLMFKLLRPMLKFYNHGVSSINSESSQIQQDQIKKQTSLLTIQLMCKIAGSEHSREFLKALPIVVNAVCTHQTQPKVRVCALLCLAEMAKYLNAHMLTYLNVILPEILLVYNSDEQGETMEFLIASSIVTLQSLITHLGSFMSSYLDSILTCICKLALKYKENSRLKLPEKIILLQNSISSEVLPRILLPATEQSYKGLLEENSAAVGPLIETLSYMVSKTEAIDLVPFFPSLQNFYLLLLSFRCDASSEISVIEAMEEKIIESTLALVMKMSEPLFYTFFNQISTWAIPSSVDEESGLQGKYKSLTFYRLTSKLAMHLKTLFVPCSKKFICHCVIILNDNNSMKSNVPYFELSEDVSVMHSVKLLCYVIDTLSFCFKNDKGILTEKEYFDALMQPLIDQIENSLGGDEAFHDRIENHLSSCLANFIALFSDSALWKSLNYQLLLKTRHSSPKVRFAALQVLRSIVREMNTNYLVLLPESIPFLAEIMEDESFEVEQECQDVIVEMEKILGEPIKKYF